MKHPKPKRHIDQEAIESIKIGQCMLCGNPQVDACHIRSRGAGGPDKDWNLLRMCREHHTQQHKMGFQWMCRKYPVLFLILRAKGWELQKTFDGKFDLWHPNLTNPADDS